MAKGNFTQKDLMIWTMDHPNGTKFFYVIEKEPFLKEGFKKSVNRVGSNFGDAVFRYLDQAKAELAKWPPGEEEKPAEAAPADTTDPGGAPPAADGETETEAKAKEAAEAGPKAPAPETETETETVKTPGGEDTPEQEPEA